MNTREEAKELIEYYDFTIWAIINNEEFQCMDEQGINININWDTKDFRFRYTVPKTIFTVECPKCSPFTNREHFDKMYQKFREVIFQFKRVR